MGIGSPSCLLYTLSLPAHPGEEREVPFELLLNRDTGCTNFRDYRTLLISHDFVVCHTILSQNLLQNPWSLRISRFEIFLG